jgi:N-formylglutamate deformylase
MNEWLEIRRGGAPLIVSLPHSGTDIPADIQARLVTPWHGRKDTDWWVHQLYDMAVQSDATTIRTMISRTVIDVNRDPSGASLYPGQNTTALCPLTTFDGEALYRAGCEPDAVEIASRRERFFEPYHGALDSEIQRLRSRHRSLVLYDAHSIRSRIPRLFEGLLPHLNIGTNQDTSCNPALTRRIEAVCAASRFSWITNGRFRGGWTTRHYGQPARGVHALQMELACRGYLDEPDEPLGPHNWPVPYEAARARDLCHVLAQIVTGCIAFLDPLQRRAS